MSVESGFIVSSRQGVHVQASHWKATVTLNIIAWCCESYHKLNFCFCLHWWSLDRGWACNLGVQVCWWNNLETLVLLGISLETGPGSGFVGGQLGN